MLGWLKSLEKFIDVIPNQRLVLPAHNMPFFGLHERVGELLTHHED
jgi:hypothetical protein